MDDIEPEAWRKFSDIHEAAINEELARVGASLEEFRQHGAHRSGPPRTAQQRADEWHGLLIAASVLNRKEHVLPEFRVCLADYAASRVVEAAQHLADGKGRIGELSEAMEAIRRREGLTDPLDDWRVGEGPADYQALAVESEREYQKIADTVFPFILRRYRMDDLADLFERDPRTFALRSEIGRRITFGDAPASTQWMDRAIRREHGEDALAQVKTRVAEIRRVEGSRR